MIPKRPGTKFVAAFDEGSPLKLEVKGDVVKVTREGRLVAFLTKLGLIRSEKAKD